MVKQRTNVKSNGGCTPDPVMETTLYKASHINHPSGIWTRECRENYMSGCILCGSRVE